MRTKLKSTLAGVVVCTLIAAVPEFAAGAPGPSGPASNLDTVAEVEVTRTVIVAVQDAYGNLLPDAELSARGADGQESKAVAAADGTLQVTVLGSKLTLEINHPVYGRRIAETMLPNGDPVTLTVSYPLAEGGVNVMPLLLEDTPVVPLGGVGGGPGNDDCEDAIGPLGVPSTTSGSSAGASSNPFPACGTSITPGVWYTVIGTGNTLTASTCNQADYDTKLTVYCNGCTEPTCIIGNDDTSGCVGFTTEVSWCTQAGAEYLILVHGFSSATGDFDLSISDDGAPCSGAVECLPEGGCCLPDATCITTTETDCSSSGGGYLGDDTDCAGDPDRGEPGTNGIGPGACCRADFSCVTTTQDCCAFAGGTFQGAGTDCSEGVAVYDATGLGLGIPDNNAAGVTHTINVPDSFTITDLNVDLFITHTWVGDLCVELEHDGTTVRLIQRMGGDLPCASDCCGCSANNLLGVILDDEGTGGPIEDQCIGNLTSAPNYTPQEALSAFDGLDASGDWTITVTDYAGGDAGSLDGWSLHLEVSGEDPCIVSAPLDIKPGSCPNPLNRTSRGVLPVGLLGSADFDVSQVDVSSVTISRADGVGGAVGPNEGPPGPHTVIDKVGTPFDGELCDCHDLTTDGLDDLMMHFRTQDLVDTLGLDGLNNGDYVELVVSGVLSNGLPFQASDCIVIVPPGNNNLTVTSNLVGAFVEVSPLDINVDGAGFATFQRSYPIGALVYLTAPDQIESGKPFRRWSIDGVLQHPGDTTVHLTLMENATVRALYRLGNIKQAAQLADGESVPDGQEAGSRSQPASGASAGGAGACGALSGMGLIALPLCLMGWMVKRGRAGRRS